MTVKAKQEIGYDLTRALNLGHELSQFDALCTASCVTEVSLSFTMICIQSF